MTLHHSLCILPFLLFCVFYARNFLDLTADNMQRGGFKAVQECIFYTQESCIQLRKLGASIISVMFNVQRDIFFE